MPIQCCDCPEAEGQVKTSIAPEDVELAQLAAALGHPARVAIVRYLKAKGSCICGEIVELLPLAQSTVSQHLKTLRQAGLIQGETDGPRSCYCLNEEKWERCKVLLGDI